MPSTGPVSTSLAISAAVASSAWWWNLPQEVQTSISDHGRQSLNSSSSALGLHQACESETEPPSVKTEQEDLMVALWNASARTYLLEEQAVEEPTEAEEPTAATEAIDDMDVTEVSWNTTFVVDHFEMTGLLQRHPWLFALLALLDSLAGILLVKCCCSCGFFAPRQTSPAKPAQEHSEDKPQPRLLAGARRLSGDAAVQKPAGSKSGECSSGAAAPAPQVTLERQLPSVFVPLFSEQSPAESKGDAASSATPVGQPWGQEECGNICIPADLSSSEVAASQQYLSAKEGSAEQGIRKHETPEVALSDAQQAFADWTDSAEEEPCEAESAELGLPAAQQPPCDQASSEEQAFCKVEAAELAQPKSEAVSAQRAVDDSGSSAEEAFCKVEAVELAESKAEVVAAQQLPDDSGSSTIADFCMIEPEELAASEVTEVEAVGFTPLAAEESDATEVPGGEPVVIDAAAEEFAILDAPATASAAAPAAEASEAQATCPQPHQPRPADEHIVHLKLKRTSKQSLLAGGFSALFEQLGVTPEDCSPSTLPRFGDGRSKLLRPFIFEKLLREEVQLRSLHSGDVSAAQGDLRHLSLQQLLLVRVRSLDFTPQIRTHEAHHNFFSTLERFIFERLAQRALSAAPAPEAYMPAESGAAAGGKLLCRLGRDLVLLLGAASAIGSKQRVDQKLAAVERKPTPLPRFWLASLQKGEWPAYQAVLIHAGVEPWILPLIGDSPDEVVAASDGELVALMAERSRHWEIEVFDPREVDAFEELRIMGSRQDAR